MGESMNETIIKREKLRRLEATPHRYYIPTGVSETFINAVFRSEVLQDGSLSSFYFVSLYSAANGVGKTCLGANILANLIWPENNPFFQQKLAVNWPYLKKIRIVSDPTSITEAIIPELKNWFPAGRYKTDKAGKHYESKWKTDNGWEIDIMSYDQALKEFESTNLGLIWLDEPPPESIYKACVSRLRRGGIMFITATPLTGSAWIYDQIISNPDKEAGRRFYIEADVESACVEHGVRGFLIHDNIERMISEYSEDEKQARIYGKFQHLVGLVYKQWNRAVHVIRPFHINFKDYTVIQALDPHPRNPDATIWIAVDKHNQKFIIDELWLKCQGGAKELSERIWKKDQQYRVTRRLADPSAFIEDQHTGKSLITRLESFYPFNYLEATKSRTASDRRIGEALDYQKVGDEFIVTPELYVFDNCVRTIFEIEHWRWDEWIGKQTDKHNKKEKPVDKDDHMIENIGRILIQEPAFETWITEQEENRMARSGESKGVLSDDDPYYDRESFKNDRGRDSNDPFF